LLQFTSTVQVSKRIHSTLDRLMSFEDSEALTSDESKNRLACESKSLGGKGKPTIAAKSVMRGKPREHSGNLYELVSCRLPVLGKSSSAEKNLCLWRDSSVCKERRKEDRHSRSQNLLVKS
jgi:hypothetical protein